MAAAELNANDQAQAIELLIAGAADRAGAEAASRQMARRAGFSEQAADEIVLAAAELASNLLKHAGGGTFSISLIHGYGIQIETRDAGPGMEDVEQTFADGYSTSGGLGCGLGAANRLMDEIDIESAPGCGTRIISRRWPRPAHGVFGDNAWDVAAFTRSLHGAPANGDAFVIKEWHGNLLLALIDGLGHGEPAQKAALAAQLYVQSHYDQSFERIFQGAGRACRGTRGAVMALARFDASRTLEFASFGNIQTRAWTGDSRLFFIVRRGILGLEKPRIHVQRLMWNPEWTLVLHTDGLKTPWDWADFPGLEKQPARAIAATLMHALCAGRDDATVLAARKIS